MSNPLHDQFSNVKLEIVDFDNGNTPESMAAYILVSNLSPKQLKNKGLTALDLGNFLYQKLGIIFEPRPEYHRKSEPKNSAAFYISKDCMELQPHLTKALVELYNSDPERGPVKTWQAALYQLKRIPISNPVARET